MPLRIKLNLEQEQKIRRLKGRYSAHLEDGHLVIAEQLNEIRNNEQSEQHEKRQEISEEFDDLLS